MAVYAPIPAPLDHMQNGTWTKAQGDEFFRWFLDTKAARVTALLGFLEVEPSLSGEELLGAVGRSLVSVVQRDSTFVNAAGLTATGFRLEVDLGAMYGDQLLTVFPETKWMIDTAARHAMSRLRPVIGRFPILGSFDPVNMSGVTILKAAEGMTDELIRVFRSHQKSFF